MSGKKPSDEELQQRLEQAEAALAALRRGEVDLVLGDSGPLLVRLKSLIDENERLTSQWKATFDAAGDAIFVLDTEHRVLRANRAAEAAFDCPRAEMIGKRCCEIVHGTAAPIPDCPFHRMRTSLQRERLEMQVGERWFAVTTDPILDEAGRLTAAVHIARDITERKQAEEALRESQERFRRLAENAQDLIYRYEFKPRRGFTYVSPIATTMTGYTPEEHYADPELGRELIHPDDRPLLEQYFQGQGVFREPLILRWVRKDGSVLWTEQRNVPIFDDAGDLVAIEGIARDITERKQAEEALRESEERFRRAVEHAPYPAVIHAEDGEVLLVNAEWTRITGFRREDIPTVEAWIETSFGERREAARQLIASLFTANGPMAALDTVIRCRDGTTRTWSFRSTPLGRDGRGRRLVLSMAVDITEREMLEAQLRQAQKMEAIGRLAGGVAHDFNNLLQAMATAVHALRLRCPDAAVARTTAELEKYVKRGADLTRQLLLSSRRAQPQIEPTDINEVVRHAEILLGRLLPENIAMVTELAEGELFIDGDPAQLEQVLMNLAINARDAMPEGGRLVLRTGCLSEAEVFVDVEDSGVGIPPDVRERIFEPFFTTKAQGAGTGLGLSVVHGIVTQHGGRVEVQSEPGRGSLFRVVLPRRLSGREERSAAVEAAARPAGGGGERVLVVEDEQGAREGLAEILALLGYEVKAVPSAEEALAVPEDPPFHAVLTDLMLPGMTGGRLATTLSARWPELGVILMSGYPEDERVRHEVPAGVRFLQKPFDMDTLAQALRAVLDARRS
jgi:two-component system cell cycle sensor histidine kinase/response regulator CckA